MRGQPGHSRAALALRCSRQRVCISAPMFHVSVERVIYVCMNIGGGWWWWHIQLVLDSHSPLQQREWGGGTSNIQPDPVALVITEGEK